MIIEVFQKPACVIINGKRIVSAPPIAELLTFLGTPTRVETGDTPAPTGFRSNQLHVYDTLGVHIYEHHYTRRAEAIALALSIEERQYDFTPTSPFKGTLRLDGQQMPLHATEDEFLTAAPWPFNGGFNGGWSCAFSDFSVFVSTVGHRLPSKRRSKRRMVVSVNISWPHDPHATPATND